MCVLLKISAVGCVNGLLSRLVDWLRILPSRHCPPSSSPSPTRNTEFGFMPLKRWFGQARWLWVWWFPHLCGSSPTQGRTYAATRRLPSDVSGSGQMMRSCLRSSTHLPTQNPACAVAQLKRWAN